MTIFSIVVCVCVGAISAASVKDTKLNNEVLELLEKALLKYDGYESDPISNEKSLLNDDKHVSEPIIEKAFLNDDSYVMNVPAEPANLLNKKSYIDEPLPPLETSYADPLEEIEAPDNSIIEIKVRQMEKSKKNDLVNAHNEARRRVSPNASNMMEMVSATAYYV